MFVYITDTNMNWMYQQRPFSGFLAQKCILLLNMPELQRLKVTYPQLNLLVNELSNNRIVHPHEDLSSIFKL